MNRPQGFLELDYRLRRAALWLLYLVIFALLVFLINFAQPVISFSLTVLSPFIVALIIAYIFNPIVTWLQREFKVGRVTGVVLTYGLILTLFVGFFSILVPILYGQAKAGITSAITNSPAVVEKASNWLSLKVTQEELAQARAFMQDHFDVDRLSSQAGATMKEVTQQAFDTTRLITRVIGTSISIVIGGIVFIGFVIVICFYFLLDYRNLEHVARVLLPDDKESRVFAIWANIDHALGGYLRGQLMVATIVGVIYTVVLSIMGMKEYAIFIGFLAGFGNMIPYAGPVLGGVPAGLWILFGNTYDTSQEKLIGVGLIVGLSIAVQTLDGLYMQPRIVGKNAQLHPIIVLLALLIGAQFGFGGMIIAVPIAIVVRVLVKELWWDPLEQIEYESKQQALKKQFVHEAAAPVATPREEIIEPEPAVKLEEANEADATPDTAAPTPPPAAEKKSKNRRRRKR